MAGFENDPTLWSRLVRQVALATGRRDEAQDYLNSAWLKLAEYRDAPVRNPEAFMVRAAINLARDDVRRQRRQASGLPTEQLTAFADPTPPADEILDARRRLERVQRALQQMNPRTARIVVMHRVEGLTYAMIAQRLGVSESAVEKHMVKATLALMKHRRTS